jgi:hypothetical protein
MPLLPFWGAIARNAITPRFWGAIDFRFYLYVLALGTRTTTLQRAKSIVLLSRYLRGEWGYLDRFWFFSCRAFPNHPICKINVYCICLTFFYLQYFLFYFRVVSLPASDFYSCGKKVGGEKFGVYMGQGETL